MKNWEILQKKISEMNKEEFIKFAREKLYCDTIRNILGFDVECDIECKYNYEGAKCKKELLEDEYQPPKQEKWIVHRTLRTSGLEYYVSDKRAVFGLGLTYYNLGNLDYQSLCSICYKKYAKKFNKEDALVVRDLLNQDRVGKQYLWVTSRVEE